MFSLFESLLARVRTWQPRSQRPRNRRWAPRKTPYQPQLEWLEDRMVPSATASISGHVLVDQTGNGLSADDTPQRDVLVRLYADTNHNGVLDSHDRLVAVQFTDARGAYSFANVVAGTYFVSEWGAKRLRAHGARAAGRLHGPAHGRSEGDRQGF